MKDLFGKEIKPKDNTIPQAITIEISEDYKNELKNIQKSRIKYYSERMNEILSDEECKEIEQNIEDMFNFHITKSSLSKQIDFFNETKLTLALNRTKEGYYNIKNLNNYRDSKKEPKELIKPVLEVIKKDYSVGVKYCVLGYINNKRKIKYYD